MKEYGKPSPAPVKAPVELDNDELGKITRLDYYVAHAMSAMIALKVARSALPHEAITLAKATMAALDEFQ